MHSHWKSSLQWPKSHLLPSHTQLAIYHVFNSLRTSMKSIYHQRCNTTTAYCQFFSAGNFIKCAKQRDAAPLRIVLYRTWVYTRYICGDLRSTFRTMMQACAYFYCGAVRCVDVLRKPPQQLLKFFRSGVHRA